MEEEVVVQTEYITRVFTSEEQEASPPIPNLKPAEEL